MPATNDVRKLPYTGQVGVKLPFSHGAVPSNLEGHGHPKAEQSGLGERAATLGKRQNHPARISESLKMDCPLRDNMWEQ